MNSDRQTAVCKPASSSNTANNYTLIMPDNDASVITTFIPTYTITFNSNDGSGNNNKKLINPVDTAP